MTDTFQGELFGAGGNLGNNPAPRRRARPAIGDPKRNARTTDPVTSHKAASLALGSKATDRVYALRMLAAHPVGLTDFELADLLGSQQTSIGKRRGELRDKGYVEATDSYRPAPSGADAIVWRITQDGAQALADLEAAPGSGTGG